MFYLIIVIILFCIEKQKVTLSAKTEAALSELRQQGQLMSQTASSQEKFQENVTAILSDISSSLKEISLSLAKIADKRENASIYF